MSTSAYHFAQQLTEAVHLIRLREHKTIQIVQDELGYVLGRQGGSTIEYWRKGHLPPKIEDIETLAREIVQRAGVDRAWLERFLQTADHPMPERVCQALFTAESSKPAAAPPAAEREIPSPEGLAPFTAGPPITHPYYFFGREQALKRIFGLWKRFPLQNVAVIGQRRSGKTSLLHYLKLITRATPAVLRPDQQHEWLTEPEQYRWVFVDFQDPRMCNQKRLLQYLLTSMAMPVPEPCRLNRFMDVVSDQLQQPTIILMDEIGAALASSDLDLAFWWGLRSLGTNQTEGKLGFILASHEQPAQLAYEADKTSPFFNIFGYSITLGPLTERAARALIASSPLPFTPEDVAWILQQSGRWPALLQTLCHVRLMALEEGQPGDNWQEEGLHQIASYQYLLEG